MNAPHNVAVSSRRQSFGLLSGACLLVVTLSIIGSMISYGFYMSAVHPHATFGYTFTASIFGAAILAVVALIIGHCFMIFRGYTINEFPLGFCVLITYPFVIASYAIGAGIIGEEEGSENKWDTIFFVAIGVGVAELIVFVLLLFLGYLLQHRLPPQPPIGNPGVPLVPMAPPAPPVGATHGIPGGAPVLHARN